MDDEGAPSEDLVVISDDLLLYRSFASRTLAAIDGFDRQATGVVGLLIVDDIPETVDYLSRLLALEPDFAVLGVATTGEEGIQAAVRLRPDVVLMDLMMPGMGGLEATRQLLTRLPTVRVVVMSVMGDYNGYTRRVFLAGASEYLVKPFSIAELTSALRRAAEIDTR
jgi:two-component system, NarL family, response regulator LiaR